MQKMILAAIALPVLVLAGTSVAQQVPQPWQDAAPDAALCEAIVATAWQRNLTEQERQLFMDCIAADRSNVAAQTDDQSKLLTKDGLIGDLPWALEQVPSN